MRSEGPLLIPHFFKVSLQASPSLEGVSTRPFNSTQRNFTYIVIRGTRYSDQVTSKFKRDKYLDRVQGPKLALQSGIKYLTFYHTIAELEHFDRSCGTELSNEHPYPHWKAECTTLTEGLRN